MNLAWLKSISGWAAMNFCSASCFFCSSLVGRPSAFCRWSYLHSSRRGCAPGWVGAATCHPDLLCQPRQQKQQQQQRQLLRSHPPPATPGEAAALAAGAAAHIIFSTVARISGSAWRARVGWIRARQGDMSQHAGAESHSTGPQLAFCRSKPSSPPKPTQRAPARARPPPYAKIIGQRQLWIQV